MRPARGAIWLGVKGGTVSGQPDPIGVGLARDSFGRILGWTAKRFGAVSGDAQGAHRGAHGSVAARRARYDGGRGWGQGDDGGSGLAGRGRAWRGRRRRGRHAGMRNSGKGPGGGRAHCTPNGYDGQEGGREGGGRGEFPAFRQAQGRLRAGPSTGSGQAFGGRGQAFDRFGVSEGGANSGVLKRGGRDTPMGGQAEEEVDRCPVFAADVSSFGVNVSSFHPNVSTFRANVSSLRPNVSSRG